VEIKRISQPYTVNPSTETRDEKERRDAEAEEEKKRKAAAAKPPASPENDNSPDLSQMPDSEKVVELLSIQPPSEIHQVKRLISAFSDDKKRKKTPPR
jgi:hypothetical protein